jgi:hypothetical protein
MDPKHPWQTCWMAFTAWDLLGLFGISRSKTAVTAVASNRHRRSAKKGDD